MFFSKVLSIVALAAAASAQSSVSVSYDTTYDNSALDLNTVACSDGANGLVTKGYTTAGSLPDFPYIGGAPAVTGWNSASCGTCWTLAYNGNSINVLAIDVGEGGFNIAEAALNFLTNNQAVALGRITATATQVDASVCGL
ncbi:hypothetical protein M406DRAFT_54208 [Cryphonectria parasitica EP155]|uniref:Cerato-platanin n=1 Tax=Cryphonectria parasitica (strain ATCC 38755 / EP155) TaxID=660469 RepID=A0A9P4YE32_CRYP1|nr:uncharacterized protein M406DRAFT_54208 [Cryphonectria parasitica EP155]KAF3771179.1 hypothetical protein M406DRAFT_54208 [Cryphonectria parasitica EP155]